MTFIKNLKPRNVYEAGYTLEEYAVAQLNPKASVWRYIPETELKVVDKNKIQLIEGSAERRTGRLIYELVNFGSEFRNTFPTAAKVDFGLLLVAAGDSITDFCFAQAEDVWAIWRPETLSDSPIKLDNAIKGSIILSR